MRRVGVLLRPRRHLLGHRLVLGLSVDVVRVLLHVLLLAQVEATHLLHALHVHREEVVLDGAVPGDGVGT